MASTGEGSVQLGWPTYSVMGCWVCVLGWVRGWGAGGFNTVFGTCRGAGSRQSHVTKAASFPEPELSRSDTASSATALVSQFTKLLNFTALEPSTWNQLTCSFCRRLLPGMHLMTQAASSRSVCNATDAQCTDASSECFSLVLCRTSRSILICTCRDA